ncbi:MAG: hypothetical protein ABI369_13550 [Acetobacteraceae bacterium]
MRDALIDAGARPEIAGKAADELAAYDDQFDGLRLEMREGFASVRHEMCEGFAKVEAWFPALDLKFASLDERFARIEEQFTRVYWMMGVLIVFVAAVLGRLLFIH